MGSKKLKWDLFLWQQSFNGDRLLLAITKGKLSEYDIKVSYKDLEDSEYWKTPKHIHWIFDIMIKKEHSPEQIKEFVNFLIEKWNVLDYNFCSEELKALYEGRREITQIYEEIKPHIINLNNLDEHGYFPKDFLLLFGYLMILQEKNNRKDAYMFKKMLDGVVEDVYNPYKVISIATWRYSW